MPGRHRTSTKEESTGVLTFEQKAWGGGQNSDQPASAVAANEVPLLQDLVAFKEYCESHGGSQVFSNTAIPGSGDIRALKYHKAAQAWCLVRGSGAWVASAAMPSWTQIYYESSDESPAVAGDTGSQLSGIALKGFNSSNTNAGVLPWNLTNAGDPVTGVRTLDIFKDAGKTQLVGRATRSGDGFCNIVAQNNSGLHGWLTIAYTSNDTDAGNTFTVTLAALAFGVDYNCNLRELDKNFLLFTAFPAAPSIFYLDLSRAKAWGVNPNGPSDPLIGFGTQGAGTPYGYRILYTFCRIEDSSGNPDFTKNRISGVLKWEGPANSTRGGASPTALTRDYAEHWVANPIAAGTPLQFYPTFDGLINGTLLQYNADRNATHMAVWRSFDIGDNGTDPITGAGNNRELYVWDGDYPIGTSSISLTKTDDDLRASFVAGFQLRTRFWKALPHTTEIGEVTPNFIYCGVRGQPAVYYCQTATREHIGSHHPVHQVIRLDDGLQVIAKSPDIVSFICSGRSWSSSPNVYKDISLSQDGLRRSAASVFQLRHLIPSSTTIGVTDWSGFTEIQDGLFVAHCSDHTIRRWTGLSWGPDLSDSKVRKLVRKMPIGSTMGFIGDALLLWHRIDSSAAHNNKCLRYGFGGDAGIGWSTLARASWIFPPLYVGAARYQDANGVDRLIVLNNADGLFYWVETFDGPDGSGFSKLWLDKVATNGTGGTEIASALVLRERTGTQEHHTIRHQESHLSLRPAVKSAGYRGAFRVDVTGYVDDTVAAHESIVNIPRSGDISFAKEHKGRRLQTRYDFAAAGFQVIRAYSRDLEDDRRALGAGYAETNEGGYQRELLGSMKHWAGRYKARLNRATGSLYALAGSAPAQVTGPDAKPFALSFGAASYSQASTQAYTSFSFSFWVKSVTAAARIFSLGGTAFSVSFNSNTQINISGQTLAVSSIASGWHHFALVRNGSTVTVYQNGAAAGSVTLAGTIGGGAFTLNPDLQAMQLDDWRLQTSEVSAEAWAFYYDNVVNHAGGKVLP